MTPFVFVSVSEVTVTVSTLLDTELANVTTHDATPASFACELPYFVIVLTRFAPVSCVKATETMPVSIDCKAPLAVTRIAYSISAPIESSSPPVGLSVRVRRLLAAAVPVSVTVVTPQSSRTILKLVVSLGRFMTPEMPASLLAFHAPSTPEIPDRIGRPPVEAPSE